MQAQMKRIRDNISRMTQRNKQTEVRLEPPSKETLGYEEGISYDFLNSIPKVGDHTRTSLHYAWQKNKMPFFLRI